MLAASIAEPNETYGGTTSTGEPHGGAPIDANGNLTADGTRTFQWDARNQLVAINVGTHRSESSYDGFMRRVRTVERDNGIVQAESRTVWCAATVCEDRSGDGASVTRRVFGLAEQVAGAGRFLVRDHLASVVDVTDGQSVLMASYSFDPWGRRTVTGGTDSTPRGFTGHPSTGSGLSLTLYRPYDPELGRWLSQDPASFAGGVNLYAYVGNNPINLQDPLGLEPCAQKPCDELMKDILRLADELTQRYQEYNNPRWRLPLTGRMSRQSHINKINEVQKGLRKRIQDYNDQNSPTPILAPVEEVATRPMPVLSPSPVQLPELPPPTRQQMADMGAKLTLGLLLTAALILILAL